MAINLNPQVRSASNISLKQEGVISAAKPSEPLSQLPSQTPTQTPTESPAKSNIKGFFAGLGYAWVNLSETVKGLVKGTAAGILTGTAIAGADWLFAGRKNLKAKELKWTTMFTSPTKALGKTGKYLAPITGAAVLTGYMIKARLTANQRTANVDHALYSAAHRTDKAVTK